MKWSLAGVIGLICAAGLPVDAFAQAGTEQLGRARIQSLKEMHKPYDVKTAQSLPTAEGPESNAGASDMKRSARPVVIQFPGYKGISDPSRW